MRVTRQPVPEWIRRWLDSRTPAPPAALRSLIEGALQLAPASQELAGTFVPGGYPAGASASDRGDANGGSLDVEGFGPAPVSGLAIALGEAGLCSLRRALSVGERRAAANDLLVADALLTYAMEAAAEDAPEAVPGVARRYGPARLAALLEEWRAEGGRSTGEAAP
jgi:hypothetical protein